MTEAPAIGISLNFQVDKNRQLVLQSSIDRDCDKEQLDELLNKLFKAADKKVAFYDAEALVEDIEFHEKNLRLIQEDIDRVDLKHKALYDEFANSNRRGKYKPSAQQEQEKANAYLNKERFVQEIANRKEKLEKLRAKL